MASVYATASLNYGTITNTRVVELLHSKPSDLITCRLRVVELDQQVQYTAVSYVWGDPAVQKEIILDGKRFFVRKNLWQFLHQARQSGFTGFLWIDALSIDQANIQERNHQVAMMGEIYSKAALVVVWLGLGTEIMARAIRELLEIHLYKREPADWLYFSKNIKEICTAEYWKRVWIVQEFVLAKKVTIWCGMERLSDEALFRLYEVQLDHNLLKMPVTRDLPSVVYRDVVAHTLHTPALEILDCKISRKKSPLAMRFLVLFEMSERLDCLDARDRVYALLSLLDTEERTLLGVEPDYSKTSPQFYEELYNALIRRRVKYNDFNGRWLEFWLLKFQKMLALSDDDAVVRKINAECEREKQLVDVKKTLGHTRWDDPWMPLAYVVSADDKHIPEMPEALLRAHKPQPSIKDLILNLTKVFESRVENTCAISNEVRRGNALMDDYPIGCLWE